MSSNIPEETAMSTTRRLWIGLAALLLVGFGTLLWMGGEIHRQAPIRTHRVEFDGDARSPAPLPG